MPELTDLKQRLRDQRDLLNELQSTRLHRALSWLNAAQQHDEDADLRFICSWISFSACCFVEESSSSPLEEQLAFQNFIQQLVNLDPDERIYDCLWHQFSGPVRALIKNPYVFAPFWESQRRGDDCWKEAFDLSSVAALNFLSRKKVPELLGIVLDRLYVLHNQVVRGGATWQSRVNREQVEDGGKLLLALMPVVIDIMLTHSDHDWGELAYPVVK
ncbi:MAG: hypothetical protein CMI08_09575 [Oceanospirillaceae bacterium]|uniref:hypothetical protein n=1 Tax=unclassified Thalassolituus TaxID=2624967 RepID=UPI000C092743|nr:MULTISPECIES: hypothetical protein [unclassified Thalassolituus]MAK92114.1 hypothetical protein [Thalassolituus sp.]MAX99437.1 hypothetical protein [Oceanospirillaceae bacterium]MBS54675.1 hypothetical protein [Oceanospirillaceae bacterium]|tara:strand:+ start:184 stop:831 length:648 start_codon:yes stop_codon:yes gene_type:complete